MLDAPAYNRAARFCVAQAAAMDNHEVTVGHVMASEPVAVTPDLPVTENGRIVGIVSARQLIAFRSEHLNRMVEERTQELQRLYDEVSARDAEMRLNMNVAGRLQTRLLLPGSPPGWPEIHWGIHYAPLDPLGGDYYDL